MSTGLRHEITVRVRNDAPYTLIKLLRDGIYQEQRYGAALDDSQSIVVWIGERRLRVRFADVIDQILPLLVEDTEE